MIFFLSLFSRLSRKTEFELNIVIVLATGDLITENFPLKLVRY